MIPDFPLAFPHAQARAHPCSLHISILDGMMLISSEKLCAVVPPIGPRGVTR